MHLLKKILSMAIKLHILEDLTNYLMQEHSQLRTKSRFMICDLCYVRVASERELRVNKICRYSLEYL